MKKVITIVLSVLTFVSCTKKSSSTGSSGTGGGSSVSLNATETSLLGTWYQIKLERRHILAEMSAYDSVYTGFDKSCFVTFTKDPYIGTTSASNAGNYKNANIALSPGDLRSWPGAGPIWWYYDEATKFLQLNGSYKIISLSGSNLTIKINKAGMWEETVYLSK